MPYVIEEDYDRDDDDMSAHTDKLAALLGYTPGENADSLYLESVLNERDGEGGYGGERHDQHRITGSTPPPDCMSVSEKNDWQYLSQALIQATDMEGETKEYTERTKATLCTAEVLRVDIRWLYLMGAVCRVMGSTHYRWMARSFYQWKYVDIGGPTAVGLYTNWYHLTRRTSSANSPSRKQALPLTSRMTPALVFALRVLGRYARRCKYQSRLTALSSAWSILTSQLYLGADLTRGVDTSVDVVCASDGEKDDLGTSLDLEGTMDCSFGVSVASIFPALEPWTTVEEGGGVGCVEEGGDVLSGKEEVEDDESSMDEGEEEVEEEEEGDSESESNGEEPEDLTVLGPLPQDLQALLKPNEVCVYLLSVDRVCVSVLRGWMVCG